MRPVPTYWCPDCKRVSVADRDDSGDIHCLLCEDDDAEPRADPASAISDIRADLAELMK